MQIKTAEGTENVASAGVGNAGLTLGIIGTALSLLGGGIGGGVMPNPVNGGFSREEYNLRADLAREKAERYADTIGLEAYKTATDKVKELAEVVYNLDKKVAVDGQSIQDNFGFLNNKIDQTKQEIICYANSTFVPGKLVMPLDNICPEPMKRYNSFTTPTSSDTTT